MSGNGGKYGEEIRVGSNGGKYGEEIREGW